MKQSILPVVLLLVLGLLTPMTASVDAADATVELKALVTQWDDAYINGDAAVLGPLLADEFVLTDASGAVLTKTDYLRSTVKQPEFSRVRSHASENVEVRLFGDTAIVTGFSPVKGRARGRSQGFAARYRFTDVWVRQQGKWKAVATHSTRVGPDRP